MNLIDCLLRNYSDSRKSWLNHFISIQTAVMQPVYSNEKDKKVDVNSNSQKRSTVCENSTTTTTKKLKKTT